MKTHSYIFHYRCRMCGQLFTRAPIWPGAQYRDGHFALRDDDTKRETTHDCSTMQTGIADLQGATKI